MMHNLLDDVPASLPDELLQTILARPGLQIERIVSQGHASPPGFWYDQPRHEFVVLLAGAARLRFDDGGVDDRVLEMRPGSYVDIAAHVRHRVDWTDPARPTIWLAIHYGDVIACEAHA